MGELMGINSSYYTSSSLWTTTCQRVIKAPEGTIIDLFFSDVFLRPGDTLDVYDGPRCGDVVSIDPTVDALLGPRIRSLSTAALLLHLDGPVTGIGFSMQSLSNAVCIRLTFNSASASMLPVGFHLKWQFVGLLMKGDSLPRISVTYSTIV